MKKISFILFALILGMAFNGFAQTTKLADFFAGKWEIAVNGTPRGDVKFTTDLVRKDGKLTGDLVDAADTANAKRPITKVEETADKMVIYFESSQAGEIAIELTKVDDDNLKGALMSFDATAKRLK